MTDTDREKLVAHMTLTLLLLFETTPRFGARLQAYRDAGLDLGSITTDLDRRAVFASIGFKLREESK